MKAHGLRTGDFAHYLTYPYVAQLPDAQFADEVHETPVGDNKHWPYGEVIDPTLHAQESPAAQLLAEQQAEPKG